MGTLRRGNKEAFWNAATVNAGDFSNGVYIGRSADNFSFYVTTSGASGFFLQAAQIGDWSSSGDPEQEIANATFMDMWYLGNSGQGNSTPMSLTFTGAGSLGTIIPDWEPGFVRLRCVSGSNVTVTAGWELQGD